MVVGHTAIAYESKVYIFGGRNDEMVSYATVELALGQLKLSRRSPGV
jgi:hypothetical protein